MSPQLLAILPDPATVLSSGQVLNRAPTELTFRFDNNIDPASLISSTLIPNIYLRRAGGDHQLNTADDPLIVPSYMAIGNQPNEVIVRFAQTSYRQPFTLPGGTPLPDQATLDPTLPDDLYRVFIIGSGATPLKGTSGVAFGDGLDLPQFTFTLGLGSQVVSVVPQPVSRTGSILTPAVDQIDVYFTPTDLPEATSAMTRTFYELVRTTDANDVAVNQTIVNPTSVSYSNGKASLVFATGVLTMPGVYRLRIGNNDPLPLPTVNLGSAFAGSSFDTARQLGTQFPIIQGAQSVQVNGLIGASPVNVIYPGGNNEPGVRNINSDTHVFGTTHTSGVIPVFEYNFQNIIGQLPGGGTAFNFITEPQKQRVREALSYFANFAGLSFVETQDRGFTFATGDLGQLGENSGFPILVERGFLEGTGRAVINAGFDWGSSEAGGSYFRTAMFGVGGLLGMGTTFELPGLATQGNSPPLGDSPGGEPVFPGDSDILLAQYLRPPVGNDINMYRFAVPRAGTLNFETIAERLGNLNSASPQLDTVISVYDANKKLIARNDDYYGKDSFLQLQLGAGTYYVGVTSTGNTAFDPEVSGTGFGGTTQGEYQLKLTFTPTAVSGIRDASGTLLDGDGDGSPGGVHNFWFRVARPDEGLTTQTPTDDVIHTLFVDKGAPNNGNGTSGSPLNNIGLALQRATAGDVVRIVGNGGDDGLMNTVADNYSYNIGFDNIGQALSDGSTFEIPRGVTVMVGQGAIIKLRAANIDVGSSEQGIDRSGGALQVLSVPTGVLNNATDLALRSDIGSVYFTSYYTPGIGKDKPGDIGGKGKSAVSRGDWGGLVFRDDSDLESAGIFLSSVNRANLSYGGGEVIVNSVQQVFTPIHLVTARPTISFNTIVRSADAAVSADPNSFEESEFKGIQFDYDYSRSGPKIIGNTLSDNSINGLFVRIRTENGASLDQLTVAGRFSTTDMVYVIEENLQIAGAPGGSYFDVLGQFHTRPSARLAIDPGVIVKLGGARIETQMGAQFIAEGTSARPIIFTSVFDDRYGAGGDFDTTNNNKPGQVSRGADEGDWGGIFLGPLSIGSIDYALVTFAGGATSIEGGFGTFNALEIHQAQARVANSTFERNAAGGGDDRNGRTNSTPSVIFVRGAQPVLIDNVIQNNDAKAITDPNAPLKNTAAISINVNSLNASLVSDPGRSTGFANVQVPSVNNMGPLIRGNRIGNTPVNGMIVRGGTITTNVVWDDTDIVHVVQDEIVAGNQFSVNGTLRLQSSSRQSLVVKLEGATAGFTAAGTPLDIHDRIGGTLQVVGMPNHPVVFTSVFDDTVGAGFTPSGLAQTDTKNQRVSTSGPPPLSTTSGPVFLDGGDRDDHGSFSNGDNQAGWKFIEQAVNYANTNSRNAAGDGILAIGVQEDDDTPTQAQRAIESVASELGLTLTIVAGTDINTVNFSAFKLIYIPSDAFDTLGGITDADLARLTARKLDIQNYVNNVGGGLVALTEGSSAQPYAWLALPAPFTIERAGGVDLTQTPFLAAAGFNITDQELTAGTPWHNSFVGPPGFNRMQPWVIDPFTGAVVTLGLAPGTGGIGPRLSVAASGDWRSIKLDTFSNDTNVDLVNEIEQGFASTGDTNALPTTAQFLGGLAKDLKGGDDNLRLGFEIHGSISQTVNNSLFGDVDVYSFRGTAGTTLWLDIDRTASALDTVVELIDANGSVIARSNDSLAELTNQSLLVGIAKPLRMGFSNSAGEFTSPDFYSTNPRDAGMRLDLPGTLGTLNTYFVRVRASSSDLDRVNGGLTKGAYQLQLRLQDLDVFPGSVVRSADIRFATNGIEIIGKPERSMLLGDTAETSTVHNTFETAQNLGNLLTSSSNAITVAGNLGVLGEVDWFKFDLNYDLASHLFSDIGDVFPTLFQINYADGLNRPDTTISVFDELGNLIYIGRDSDNLDSLPRSSLGSDTSNSSHGSFGVLDPTIGSVQLPAGNTAGAKQFSYYVAVSASRTLPTILDATFDLEPSNPAVRLQPVNSVRSIFNDSVGGSAAGSTQAFPGSAPAQLNAAATPLSLGDVVAYVVGNGGDDLFTINPFTGQLQTIVTHGIDGRAVALPGAQPNGDRFYADLAMRNDGRLMTIPTGGNAQINGTYTQINTGNGTAVSTQDGGISGLSALLTFDIDTTGESSTQVANGPDTFIYIPAEGDFGVAVNGMTFGEDVFSGNFGTGGSGVIIGGRVLYVVGNRGVGNGSIIDTQNLLFRLNPNTGAPFGFDFESNGTFHSGNPVYRPFAPDSDPTEPVPPSATLPLTPGPGTEVIPRGTLTTGVFMVGQAATAAVAGTGGGFFAVPNDIIDGAAFVIGDPGPPSAAKRFEFDSGPQLNLDKLTIPGVTGIASLRNGQTFSITGPGPSPNTTLALDFQLLSGPVLSVVGSGAGMVGQTFSITDQNSNTVVFEFGNPGAVTPGRVAVPTAATPALLAANIRDAINITAKAQFPSFVGGAALPSATSTRVTLTGDLQQNAAVDVTGAAGLVKVGNWNILPGHVGVLFEETDSMATFGTNLASIVRIAFSDTVTASFARDRITFAGATVANFNSFVNASPEFSQTGAAGVSVAGSVRVRFNAGDTAEQIAAAVQLAIASASMQGSPVPIGVTPSTYFVTAEVDGTVVKISNAKFTSTTNLPLLTDADSFGFSIVQPGNQLVTSLFPGNIEGIAFTPADASHSTRLYGVSSAGALYEITNFVFDNAAQLKLLNIIPDVSFTGVTAGPPFVEGGRYAQMLFATDSSGGIWAFDDQGQPAPVLLDGATHVSLTDTFGFFGTGNNFFGFGLEGITFSTVDYNPWHATTTHGSDPLGDAGGNKSFYFGLEAATVTTIGQPNVLPSAYWQPGATDYVPVPGGGEGSGNRALSNSYNYPGGALGSLTTREFDLTGYTAFDKPTLYFDYALDTENAETQDNFSGFMTDSFRVYASSDGANWTQLATNNSIPSGASSGQFSPNAELPVIPSVNGGQYQTDRINQQVQELFDPPGTAAPEGSLPGSATLVGQWRQARVDLGDFAGRKNVQIRFDFSSAGSMGIGALKQGGVYLAGVDASKLSNGQQFVIENTRVTGFTQTGPIYDTVNYTFTFRSGFVLQAPAGGGKVITSGETFTVNGTTFQLTKNGPASATNIVISDFYTAEQVAAAIFDHLVANPVAGVTPVLAGASVQLVGATLQAPAGGGQAITSGETFTVNGKTFQLLKSGSPSGGAVGISISDNLTAEGVATAISNALLSNPVAGVTPIRVGARVQLVGATSVSQGPLPALILRGAGGPANMSVTQGPSPALILRGAAAAANPAPTDVSYTIDMTVDNVANQVAAALDAQFSLANGNVDDLTIFTSSKVDGRTIRLYGHNVIDSGPLPYSNTLPGDSQGRFYTPLIYDAPTQSFVLVGVAEAARRNENNAHEGVFIDNVIVGFAGRGEQVLDAPIPPVEDPNNPPDPNLPPPGPTALSTFDVLPTDIKYTGTRIQTGDYTLSIRRGTEYVPGGNSASNPFVFSPGQTFDVNDRFAQGFTLYAVPASRLYDGQTFSIAVQARVFTFEFKRDAVSQLSAPGNIRVLIGNVNADSTAVARAIRDAINAVPASTNFGVKAGMNSLASGQTAAAVNLFGAVDVNPGPLGLRIFGQDLNFNFGIGFGFFGTVLPVLGDSSQSFVQGQTLIQGNKISDTLQTGISVTPVISGTNEDGTPIIGTPGHTGSVAQLSTLNTSRLVPSVVIKDNLIVQGGVTGILFSGAPSTDISHAVPFGRIVNNTIALTRTGIRVADNASPTILNNAIAQTTTGISVDNTSTTTVVGANIYQSNGVNLTGVSQTNAIVLQPTDPLFVDTSKRNFYLQQNSLAIDSSLNSLPDRPAMTAVGSPLGIAPSPIQAPDFDLLGLLRVDDTTVPSPPGLGSNVFKDRGAVERSDVFGPTAALRNPIDNDALGADRLVATSGANINKVLLVGQKLADFTIQLNDAGLGVDDTTVDVTKFTIERKIGNGPTTTLIPGTDFLFAYEGTNKIVKLLSAQGVWAYGTYTITLSNTIKDLVGNALQPNDPSGLTKFVIQQSQTAISPWQNPANQYDVNGSGTVSGLDALLVINQLLQGKSGPIANFVPVPTVPPYIDVDGNGSLSAFDALLVISFLTTAQAAPQAQAMTTTETVTAAPSVAAAPEAGALAPSAAPSTVAAVPSSATAAFNTNGVAVGLAMGQVSSFEDDPADDIAQGSAEYKSTVAADNAAQSASSASAGSAALAATFASEEFDDGDSDLDAILSDLTEDSLHLVS